MLFEGAEYCEYVTTVEFSCFDYSEVYQTISRLFTFGRLKFLQGKIIFQAI
jgi:hypothetical protein